MSGRRLGIREPLRWLIAGALLATGCGPRSEKTARPVVVYCSVDESFARQVFRRFEQRTKIEVSVLFDSEAGKTTGLVNRIIAEAEAGRPRAEVFWSSEVFNTILLARRGLLAAHDIPGRFKDLHHLWTATAVRARVLAFDPQRTPRETVPTSWEALSQPAYAGRLALANPLFGTTRGHVAAMFEIWGEDRGRAFLSQLHEGGCRIDDGNSSAVRSLIAGRVDFAATDTDDVWVARRSGASIEMVYPDMGDGGTLLIPCTVALIDGLRSAQGARRLVDFLVSAEVERMLAESRSRNIPVRAWLRSELGIAWPAETKVDLGAVADAMDDAVAAVREILIR